MKSFVALGVIAALALAGCDKNSNGNTAGTAASGTKVAPIAAPAGSDWTETVALTPEGGFRMGNPDAPVKLVEYASLTCPHCREFSETATESLRNEFVKSGKVSWEYRNFVLNPIDIAVSMVQRCQGAQPAFKLIEQIYASQEEWLPRLQNITDAEQARIQALPDLERFKALFAATGLGPFFGQRGATQAKIDACLSNKANLDQIVKISDLGRSDGVQGTPTFLINGTIAEAAANWPDLKTQLQAAVGG